MASASEPKRVEQWWRRTIGPIAPWVAGSALAPIFGVPFAWGLRAGNWTDNEMETPPVVAKRREERLLRMARGGLATLDKRTCVLLGDRTCRITRVGDRA